MSKKLPALSQRNVPTSSAGEAPLYRDRAFLERVGRDGWTNARLAKKAGCAKITIIVWRGRYGLIDPARTQAHLSEHARYTYADPDWWEAMKAVYGSLRAIAMGEGISFHTLEMWNYRLRIGMPGALPRAPASLPPIARRTLGNRRWFARRVYQGDSNRDICEKINRRAEESGVKWRCNAEKVRTARISFRFPNVFAFRIGALAKERAEFGKWLRKHWDELRDLLTPRRRRILRLFYMNKRLRNHYAIADAFVCFFQNVYRQRLLALEIINRRRRIPERFRTVTWSLQSQDRAKNSRRRARRNAR